MSKVRDFWRPVRARLREPSSWNGIAILFLLFGIGGPEVTEVITQGPTVIEAAEGSEVWRNGGIFGSFISSVVALVMRERDKASVDADKPEQPAL